MKIQLLPSGALAAACTLILLTGCGQPPETRPVAGGIATDHTENSSPVRGAHGGKLLRAGKLALEVTIFEEGVPPEFRVYPTLNDKPLNPAQVRLTITLKRLGGDDVIRFKPQNDYLVGDREVSEPHSFSVALQASHDGRTYDLGYDQVEGRVQLSADQIKAGGIETLAAEPGLVGDIIELPGEIRVAPNSEAVVLAPVAGVVTLAPVMLGQEVRRGEVLAVMESRELADMQRGYLEARERARLAEATYRREAQLWQERITPEQDYLAARSAKAEADISVASQRAGLMAFGVSAGDVAALSLARPGNLSRLTLRAPRDGRVTARDLAPGQRVTPDSPLFTIADLSQLVAVVSASASQLDGLRPGQQATLALAQSAAGKQAPTGTGRVRVVSPQLDEASRSAPVHITLDDGQTGWRPGQFVKARITRAQTQAAVTVSPEALQTFRDQTVVFARYGDQFEIRPVTLGRQDGKRVEIIDGLKAGQAYVGKNSFLLKADLGKSEAEHGH